MKAGPSDQRRTRGEGPRVTCSESLLCQNAVSAAAVTLKRYKVQALMVNCRLRLIYVFSLSFSYYLTMIILDTCFFVGQFILLLPELICATNHFLLPQQNYKQTSKSKQITQHPNFLKRTDPSKHFRPSYFYQGHKPSTTC